MQHLEVSGAVRHIYIIRLLKVNMNEVYQRLVMMMMMMMLLGDNICRL